MTVSAEALASLAVFAGHLSYLLHPPSARHDPRAPALTQRLR
ncbi:hypothetical protein [Paractinoplanes maris]|nr:hypothetical protein [Actinoplanes maris]